MKAIFSVLKYTLRDSLKKNYLILFLILFLILIGGYSMISLMELKFEEKIMKDFLVLGIDIMGLLICFILAGSQIPDEIQQKNLYYIFTKPITRGQYVIGNFLSILCILLISLLVLTFTGLIIIHKSYGLWDFSIFWAFLSVFFKLMITSSIILSFSLFFSKVINMSVSLLIYFSAQFSAYALSIIENNPLNFLLKPLIYLLPNFYLFDISYFIIHGTKLDLSQILWMGSYSISLSIIILCISIKIFNHRDI